MCKIVTNTKPTTNFVEVTSSTRGRSIDLSEGCMVIDNSVNFVVNDNTYQISTDGCMKSDKRIDVDDKAKLPDILKPYSSIIDRLVSDHPTDNLQLFYRRFIFVDASNESFKTFIMIDAGLGDFDDREYDSFNMLAAHLGLNPDNWGVFVNKIASGETIYADLVGVLKTAPKTYEKVPEKTRYLVFIPDTKEYSSDDFDPNYDATNGFSYMSSDDYADIKK